jgi:hypothetical protein
MRWLGLLAACVAPTAVTVAVASDRLQLVVD